MAHQLERGQLLAVLRPCAVANWGATDEDRVRAALDCDSVREGLCRHGLTGFVHAELKAAGREHWIPEPCRVEMKTTYFQDWILSERVRERSLQLADRLEKAGFDCVFLKGPAFAERYYGDLARRVTRDVDCLVRDADIPEVNALLAAEGWERQSRLLGGLRLSMRFTHHFDYAGEDVMLELHWKLANHPSFAIDYAALFAESESWQPETGGSSLPITATHHTLLVHLLTILRDAEIGQLQIRSFVDVCRVLSREPDQDWDEFFRRCESERVLVIAVNMLGLVLGWLEVRSAFPALAEALEARRSYMRGAARPDRGLELLDPEPPALMNKLRCLPLYEGSVLGSFAWWWLSLPWRLAVYVYH